MISSNLSLWLYIQPKIKTNNKITILKWVWNQMKALKYSTSHHLQCCCYLVILPWKLLLFNLTWHLMAWWWQEMTFLVWTPAPHSWEHVDQADQRVLSVEVWDPEVIGPLPDKDISRIETCNKIYFHFDTSWRMGMGRLCNPFDKAIEVFGWNNNFSYLIDMIDLLSTVLKLDIQLRL